MFKAIKVRRNLKAVMSYDEVIKHLKYLTRFGGIEVVQKTHVCYENGERKKDRLTSFKMRGLYIWEDEKGYCLYNFNGENIANIDSERSKIVIDKRDRTKSDNGTIYIENTINLDYNKGDLDS